MGRFYLLWAIGWIGVVGSLSAQEGVWTIGAFYYGWYRAERWPPSYVRAIPSQGYYDSLDPATIEAQIREAYEAGIRVFALVYYYGPQGYNFDEIETFLQALDTSPYPMQFAVFYDTAISLFWHCRYRAGQEPLDFNHPDRRKRACLNRSFRADFQALRNHPRLLHHPRILRIYGRPVVIIYLTREMRGRPGDPGCPSPGEGCSFQDALQDVRVQRGRSYSGPLYFVGDEICTDTPKAMVVERVRQLDAVTAFGPGCPVYLGESQLITVAEKSLRIQQTWMDFVQGVRNRYTGRPVVWMPAIFAQFDDTHIPTRPKFERLTPGLSSSANFYDDSGGHGLAYFLRRLRDVTPVVDGRRFLWLTTWNEWFETSAVEPSARPQVVCRHPNDCFRYRWRRRFLEIIRAFVGDRLGTEPAPVLDGVEPSVVTFPQKTEVTLYGAFFDPSAWVVVETNVLGDWDALSVQSVQWISPERLRVRLPVWDFGDEARLRVLNPDGQASLPVSITILPVHITWLGPPAACKGQPIEVRVAVAHGEGPGRADVVITLFPPPEVRLLSPAVQSVQVRAGERVDIRWTLRLPNRVQRIPLRFSIELHYCGARSHPDCIRRQHEAVWLLTVLAGPSFADVPCSHPHFGSIEALHARQAIRPCGRDPLRFCPDTPLSRGEMALWLTRVLGDPAEIRCSSGYFDVYFHPLCRFIEDIQLRGISEACSLWFCPQLQTESCSQAPLCQTSEDVEHRLCFCPDLPIARKVAALWVMRSVGRQAVRCIRCDRFRDVTSVDVILIPWLERAYLLGLVDFCEPGRVCPNDSLPRGEAAAMVVRTYSQPSPH